MSVLQPLHLTETTTAVQDAVAVLRAHGVQARYGNFIDGNWVAPAKGHYFLDKTPIDGEPLCEVAFSSDVDVERALDAAHAAKTDWAHLAPANRAKVLNKIADRMEENVEILALAETLDNGKPIRETRNADVPLAIDHFRYFASCIRSEEGSVGEIDHDTIAYHFKEPLVRRSRSNYPVEFPTFDGGMEDRAGHRCRQLHSD
jgi:aldehyde dehydrogenase